MNYGALDILVALNIMGWRRIGLDDCCRPLHKPSKDFPGTILNLDGKGPHERLIPPDCEFDEQDEKGVWLCGCDKGVERLPCYSTDTALAVPILERMFHLGFGHEIEHGVGATLWSARFFKDASARGAWTQGAEPMPTICRAALAALDVAVPS